MRDHKELLKFIAKKLKGFQHAIRGTASLVLQGIEMNVDDIDILCDKETALKCNEIFKDCIVEKVDYKESEKFKSYFGKFKIDGIQVEIMGDWEIKDNKGNWSEVFDASDDEITEVKIDEEKIFATRVETELRMFALMGRWTAYHKIKNQILNIKTSQEKLF